MAVAVTTTWQRLCSMTTQERYEEVNELQEQLRHAQEMYQRGLACYTDLVAIEDALNEAVEELNN